MKFELTEEQQGFADALDDTLSKSDPIATARAWAAGETDAGQAQWGALHDLGLTGLIVAEEAGGFGAGGVELVIAHQAIGRHVAVGPWVETSAFLAPALTPGPELDAILGGAAATVAVPPQAPRGLDGHWAAHRFIQLDGELFAATEAGTDESIDRTRRLSTLTPTGSALPSGDLAAAFDRAALATAAQLFGSAERILEDTVGYAKQRRQFGREIGSYQAIKHQLADVRIALDFVGPLLFGAALGEIPASAAKVAAADAAQAAARTGLQVHGAIGYTAEFDLSLWLNRVRALLTAWGTPAYHRGRVLDALVAGRQ